MISNLQVFENISFISKNALLALLIIFLTQDIYAQNNIDSIKSRLSNASKKEVPSIYMDLFVASLNNYDSALRYAQLARESALIMGDSLNYIRAEYAQGYVYKNTGYFREAILHYLVALKSSRINKYLDGEKRALNGLALSYYSISKFDLALRYHFESLKIREEEGNQKDIAIATNNIGLVYYQLNDFNKALIYFERVRQIEEENEFESIYGTYVNLGLTYLGLYDHNMAFEFFTRALDNCGKNCSSQILIEGYIGKANCLLYWNKNKEALNEYHSALKLAKNHSDKVKLTTIYYNISKTYDKSNNLDLALAYLDSSQNLALELRIPRNIENNYRKYAEIAYEKGDYQKAYEYQSKYDSISKEILNEVIAKNLLQIQVDFEERENLEIIDLQNKEISRRTTLLVMAIISSVLTALVVILLYRNNRVRKRVNQKLREANETIEDQNKILVSLNSDLEERVRERTDELRATNTALIKSNNELDNFIYKTSHDIRGPLATLQGICNIALMDIKDPMSVDYFQKLSKTALKLNNILSKLLIVNQINNSLPGNEEFNLKMLVDEVVDENKIRYVKKNIDVLVKGKDRIALVGDYSLIKIIVTNIVNNAFKFHNPSESVSSFIEINFFNSKDNLKLTVIDNGLGIDASISGQIFDIFSKTSEVQDSVGMGLYLVKLAVDKLKGQINVSKTEQGYTIFTIIIPTK